MRIKSGHIIQGVIVLAILLAINVIAQYIYGSIDMTEDKRYTISEPTKELLRDIEEVVYVEVLMEGEFPAGVKRVQVAANETLRNFNNESGGYIEYEFKDPLEGTDMESGKYMKELASRGITPVRLDVPTKGEYSSKLMYPYAIFNFVSREVVVNLMEPAGRGIPEEVILNNSVSLLEYKFASALQRILRSDRGDIIITEGHGEASRAETTDFEVELRKYYNTGRVNLDSVSQINPKIELVFMIRPTQALSEQAKFVLDQYIMNGGKVIFLLDRIDVDMQEIPSIPQYVPKELDLNLDDLLFKYGARLKPNLLLDLESSTIGMVIGEQGGKPQIGQRPWMFHPIIASRDDHPITNGLGRVSFKFASTLDTIQTKTPVKKTVLLSSSNRSRTQTYPMRLGFELMKLGNDPSKFNKSNLPVTVLLEGKFPSLYENRVSEGMNQGLRAMGREFKPVSAPTKICIVSDGEIVNNFMDPKSGEPVDFGTNYYNNLTYANKDFILNLVEYMLDDKNILDSRSKKIKLRLLDKEKAQDKTKWRIINVGIPIIALLVFGGLYQFIRKRRYT